MTAKTLVKLSKNAWFAIMASLTVVTLAFVSFIMAEPQIGHSQTQTDSAEFWIRQTITGESTFLVDPTNVTMTGDINGVTGGNSTGTSQFVVQSNEAAGYFVNIDFGAAANTYVGAYAMYGDGGSEDIYDYGYGVLNEPDFGFTPEANASFAYTVAATTSTDIDNSFEHNNTDTCGGGGSNTTPDLCWMSPSSTAFRIIDTTAAAPNGATSTLKFRVNVPSGATPVPAAETYTATATLTLWTK